MPNEERIEWFTIQSNPMFVKDAEMFLLIVNVVTTLQWEKYNKKRGRDLPTLKRFSSTFIGPPQPLHAIPSQGHSGQFYEALWDVEVDEWRHLEEAHRVPLGVDLGLELIHLTPEGQVEAVAHQDFGDSGRML